MRTFTNKSTVLPPSLVCDEENMYSDEYDDTYDSDVTPAADADERRPFVTPRALRARPDLQVRQCFVTFTASGSVR